MSLSDELKKAARQAAQKVKDMMGAQTLPAAAETTPEMETGSPRTPGYDEHSGKTMKKAAEYDFDPIWAEARDTDPTQAKDTHERDREPDDDIDR